MSFLQDFILEFGRYTANCKYDFTNKHFKVKTEVNGAQIEFTSFNEAHLIETFIKTVQDLAHSDQS